MKTAAPVNQLQEEEEQNEEVIEEPRDLSDEEFAQLTLRERQEISGKFLRMDP